MFEAVTMTLADQAAMTGQDGQVARNQPGRAARRTFTAAYKARILGNLTLFLKEAPSAARCCGRKGCTTRISSTGASSRRAGRSRRRVVRPMPSRRLRTSPRVVKRAISEYNARGKTERTTYKATIAIEILTAGQEP